MTDPSERNRKLWDAWTDPHTRSSFYDVERFRRGGSTLHAPELEWVGDVRDRRLLHLQCHFGLDTLSWARLGAKATGVDFSEKAIEKARELAASCGLDVRFVAADVSALPKSLPGDFEIAFTSYGALTWLPDLDRWARQVRSKLAPGGALHVVEFHPLISMLGDDGRSVHFGSLGDRVDFEEHGSYAAPEADVHGTSTTWNHGLGDVIGAVLEAGFRIERFDELDYTPWDCFPFTHESEPGKARIRGAEGRMPMLFRLTAIKT